MGVLTFLLTFLTFGCADESAAEQGETCMEQDDGYNGLGSKTVYFGAVFQVFYFCLGWFLLVFIWELKGLERQ
jgi:hypothetical protein